MEILHRGKRIPLSGNPPQVGDLAPDFRAVTDRLEPWSLSESRAKVIVLLPLPSLDTDTCARETKSFNRIVSSLPGVEVYTISLDLPFAMRRFCAVEGINNIRVLSDFRYREFGQNYGLELSSGILQGLLSRAVLVIDQNKYIRYVEYVVDISNEPDYHKALRAVESYL